MQYLKNVITRKKKKKKKEEESKNQKSPKTFGDLKNREVKHYGKKGFLK